MNRAQIHTLHPFKPFMSKKRLTPPATFIFQPFRQLRLIQMWRSGDGRGATAD